MTSQKKDFDMITGTTEECLKHYFKFHGGSNEILSRYVGVCSRTERRWAQGVRWPIGNELMRVRVFLSLIGYRVSDFEKIGSALVAAAQCIAFGLVNERMILEELKLPMYDHFLRYYRQPGMSAYRRTALESLVARYNGERKSIADNQRTELRKKLNLPVAVLGEQAPTHSMGGVSTEEPHGDTDETIRTFIKACEIIRIQGAKLLAGSVDDRKRLRRLMNKPGSVMLHETWDTLRKLLKEGGNKQ